MPQQPPETTRIIGPGTLPPDRFARKPLPPPPSLEERQVAALERIADLLDQMNYRQEWSSRR